MLSPLLVMLAMMGTQPQTTNRPSYLFKTDFEVNLPDNLRPERYCPRAGDLVLFDDHARWQRKLYECCGTSSPLHSGIVFSRPDGSLAILEAGPGAVFYVFIFELEDRLHSFSGTMLIRQLKTPLTPEQSQRLTEFSLAQEGKKYALGRLMLQGTPIRAQGPVRTHVFGKTVLDRERWTCSELVVAALAAAGVLDGKAFPANAMYPRDLCYDERYNLSPYYEPPALWYPRPELEHVGRGIRVIDPKGR
jgi:hypothetical protein